MNKILTTKQVANIIKLHPESVRRLLQLGVLRGFKMGSYTKQKHWRIKQADLETFVGGDTVQAGTGLMHTEPSKKSVRNGV